MRSLGNGDARTRSLANLANLAAGAANDASHHVCGDGNVLSLNLLTVFVVSGRATRGSVRVGASTKGAATAVAEVGAVASTHDAGAATVIAAVAAAVVSSVARAAHGSSAGLGADNGVVEDGAGTTLPVIDEALADFPHGALDTFGRALDLDDAFCRLREHLLLCNHTHARDVLNVLDLEALSANNGPHLVVGDEKLDGCDGVSEIWLHHCSKGYHVR